MVTLAGRSTTAIESINLADRLVDNSRRKVQNVVASGCLENGTTPERQRRHDHCI
jgi:hypothetical protein